VVFHCSDLNPEASQEGLAESAYPIWKQLENIWLRLKIKVAANRLYGSMKVLLEAVDRFFSEMTPAQALAWAAE
jgi:hypothetical protein